MRAQIAEHYNGLSIVSRERIEEVQSILAKINIPIRKSSANIIKPAILNGLLDFGWSGRVKVDETTSISISAMKDETGLCLQMGNVARMYADILKLQTLFLDKRINTAIMVVPTKMAAKAMGGNLTTFERLIRELNLFSRTINVPIVIIGFEE